LECSGSWGEQDNVTEILTGFNNSISLNSVDALGVLIKVGVLILGVLKIGVKVET
jgi:hypothetical protein